MSRRNTKTQEAILSLLREEQYAMSHEVITKRLEEPIDRVTIYRTLNRFVEDGLAHRIVADDGRQYFASCQKDCAHDLAAHNHLHFRCTSCDRVECLHGAIGVELPAGYEADNYNIAISGSCKACREG